MVEMAAQLFSTVALRDFLFNTVFAYNVSTGKEQATGTLDVQLFGRRCFRANAFPTSISKFACLFN